MTLRLELAGARIAVADTADAPLVVECSRLLLGPRERVAIVGASGVGKSTLLEFLALLRRPEALDRYCLGPLDAAPVELAPALLTGRLDETARWRAGPLAYMPQGGGLLPFLDAQGNALAGAKAGGLTKGSEARIARLAGRLGLTAHLAKSREALSGGERRRIGLLRALALPRAFMVADEPTAGLDAARAEVALSLIVEVCETEGMAAVIATHDEARAAGAGFRIVRIIEEDEGKRRIEEPRLARTTETAA